MTINDIEQQIQDKLFRFLDENYDVFIDKKNNENTHVFKSLMGVIEITKDSLQQKKTNLLGCKMKIYQERLRQI